MMNRKNAYIFVLPLVISLCAGNSYAWNDRSSSTQNLVAGICAVGAAVVGAITAVALVDWCFSETDDELLARFDRECSNSYAAYRELMGCVEDSLNINSFPINFSTLVKKYSEKTLYHMAVKIAESGVSQSSYRRSLSSAKNQLQSSMSALRHRIKTLEKKHCDYQELARLEAMRSLAYKAEELINHVDFFSEYLEHHKSYFNLFETVNTLRNNYAYCFDIIEYGAYADINLKNGIIGAIGGRYPLSTFVDTIQLDIERFKSCIYALTHTYETARHYALVTFDQLMWMKNTVTIDPRYTQECYNKEQEYLQRMQLQAWKEQVRVQQAQLDALQEHNRLLREKNYMQQPDLDVRVVVNL